MTTRLGKPRHRFPTMVSLIILCIALVFPLQATASTHNALIYGYRCTGSTNNSASSTNKASPFYIYNLYNLLGSFTTQAIKSGYYNSSLGEFPNRVYALYMCRFDTDAQSCSTCVNEAKNQILKACPFQTEAIIWYENCMLHYSQSSFFGKLIISPWLLLSKPQNISKNHIADFTEIMRKSMKKLANSTAYNSKSPVKMFQTTVVNVTGVGELFELALCFPDLSHSDCFRCLSIAIDRLVISVDSRVLLPTCAVWYQTSPFSTSSANTTYPFYNSSSVSEQTLAEKPKRTSSSVVIVAISVPIVIVILLFWSACSCIYRHNYKPTKHSSVSDLEDIVGIESLQFNFKIIKDATNNFAFGNKLGQGGFGEVYKGTLMDGKEIAVKRLSINSGQGVAEFKTEIILAANLQHNNLVKILGFCLYGEEKLIIYEFCPNASLDKVLFGRIRRSLDWETRYKILLGTARGLLYLHEDSRLTIIHRDLKPSNILLDESMNPKISDFGLARLVGRDQDSQIGTSRIAGTYGYMAPEYALTGQFSVMLDVYSFGVIILEVVSGHMCSSTIIPYDKESLCLRAWSLWKDNATLDLVDPKLDGVFPIEEAMKCIHIGLLCIQEDAIKRPSMATILLALNGHHVDLAEPEPPLKGPSTINSNRFARNERQIYSKEFSSYFEDMTEIYPR